MKRTWRQLCMVGGFLSVDVLAVAVEPFSNFLKLDSFTARTGEAQGELKFPGYGGFDVFLRTREGLSRLDLRFGSRSVPLWRSGEEFGYGESSWLANKPFEWRGMKLRGGFEPYALIFRALRPREGGGRPVDSFVVVSLRGCDSCVIGVFPAEAGPLEAIRLADRDGGSVDRVGPLAGARRLAAEKVVSEWLAAVDAKDESQVRIAYSSVYLRSNGRRVAKFEGVLQQVSGFSGCEATDFSIQEQGSRIEVTFWLCKDGSGDGEKARLRVKLGMVKESGLLKISSDSAELSGAGNAGRDRTPAGVTPVPQGAMPLEGSSGLGQMLLGRWLASDGKGMLSLVFEEGGKLTWRRIGAAKKSEASKTGAWSEKDGVLSLDLGQGTEERKLTNLKDGKLKLEARSGSLFLERQR